MAFQTEFEFLLPRGYVDTDWNLNRNGVMRLATAADEIFPLKDPRVQQNPAYLTIILLSRVIVKLGNLQVINTKVVEDFFSSDMASLQDYYRRINETGGAEIKVTCPKCGNEFDTPH